MSRLAARSSAPRPRPEDGGSPVQAEEEPAEAAAASPPPTGRSSSFCSSPHCFCSSLATRVAREGSSLHSRGASSCSPRSASTSCRTCPCSAAADAPLTSPRSPVASGSRGLRPMLPSLRRRSSGRSALSLKASHSFDAYCGSSARILANWSARCGWTGWRRVRSSAAHVVTRATATSRLSAMSTSCCLRLERCVWKQVPGQAGAAA
mmetsp:Transcript_23101/g.77950  ORF Transcript_23101/g.77950 Transcript_23101/m.77950 type:complete len:207 (-) Transcript_23101:89-709(-)